MTTAKTGHPPENRKFFTACARGANPRKCNANANANVGGDNCHRGAVIGARLGAAAGTARIPVRFCEGLHDGAALRRPFSR